MMMVMMKHRCLTFNRLLPRVATANLVRRSPISTTAISENSNNSQRTGNGEDGPSSSGSKSTAVVGGLAVTAALVAGGLTYYNIYVADQSDQNKDGVEHLSVIPMLTSVLPKSFNILSKDSAEGMTTKAETASTPKPKLRQIVIPDKVDQVPISKDQSSKESNASRNDDIHIATTINTPMPPLDMPPKPSTSSNDIVIDTVQTKEAKSGAETSSRNTVSPPVSQSSTDPSFDTSDKFVYVIQPEKIETSSEFESKLHEHLKRQLEAHEDHMVDKLRQQHQEFERKLQLKDDECEEKMLSFYALFLNELVGKTDALFEALHNRHSTDLVGRSSHELWLMANALYQRLSGSKSSNTSGDSDDTDADLMMSGLEPNLSVRTELLAIDIAVKRQRAVVSALKAERDGQQIAGGSDDNSESDKFLSAVLSSVPDSLRQGQRIRSESALRSDFIRIERQVRQTALVTDVSTASPWRYAVSYVQSFFLPSNHSIEAKSIISPTSPVDVDHLTPSELVWMARSHLDRGQIEMAVRYLNLLRGEPARIARRWIDDAVQLVELRQLSLVLLAHASDCAVRSLGVPAIGN